MMLIYFDSLEQLHLFVPADPERTVGVVLPLMDRYRYVNGAWENVP